MWTAILLGAMAVAFAVLFWWGAHREEIEPHCPRCGGRYLRIENGRRWLCRECGTTFGEEGDGDEHDD